MTSKKVVDVGALRSPDLERYLSASRGNVAIITEFTTMEMFSGNAEINLRRSLAILSKFLDQVVLLKGNARISRLTGRLRGLHKRLQDEKKTRAFRKYCQLLFRNESAQGDLARDIAGKSQVAKQWRDRMTTKTAAIREGLSNLAARIDPGDLKAIRTGQAASRTFTDQTVADIMGITALHYRDIIRLDRMPSSDEALFTFPFRYAVCVYALSIKWVAKGGHINAKSETLRNDYIDMTYAAYATFFDGLITGDAKLKELYEISCWILENVFQINR